MRGVASQTSGGTALRLLPLAVLVAGIAAAAMLLPRARNSDRLTVAVSVPPQGWLVERLAGDRVDVEVLLPPGSSPHTYEPTPQQVQRLAAARLVFQVGHPAFTFEQRLLGSLPARDGREVVTMTDGMTLRAEEAEGAGETDPHVWVSPAVMRRSAQAIAAALERLDPRGAAFYRAQLPRVLTEIDSLDGELRRELAGLEQRRIYVYHPSWGYLAGDYGIGQVAIEAGGKEPSPRQLLALVEQARADGVHAVFVQQGFADRPARVLADELDVPVVTLDPLAADWPGELRRAATAFRESLRG